MSVTSKHLIAYSASLKLTLFLFFIFGISVVLWHFTEHPLKNWLITIPLLLLAFNLMTALLTNKIFRVQGWLLLFHIGLLLLLLLIGISQVTKLIGEVEVTTDSEFSISSAQWQQGVFHPNRLDQLKFKLEHFTINYAPDYGGPQRLDTKAYIIWLDEEGKLKKGVVGDKTPLKVYGYRLHTTHNKGFAPMFNWYPRNKSFPISGSVHLPPWPAFELNQENELHVPGTPYRVWISLKFNDPILSASEPSQFRIPQDALLIARVDEQRYELKPGDFIEFESGRLEFSGLNTWMGFKIYYDWSLPWILGASLLALFGLAGHFWRKFAPTPWLENLEKNKKEK